MGSIPYRYVCIEGNIGAGKTTLCERMHKEHNCSLILEEFAENPFLPYFYKNPDKYAFPLELFFMTERYKQLQDKLQAQDLFTEFILADYMFIKTLLFANINLKSDEFKIFQQLYLTLHQNIAAPDLIIYLHRDIEQLQKQIKGRGRSYEQRIKDDYLSAIQDAYFNYFRSEPNLPIVIVNINHVNFMEQQEQYDELQRIFRTSYQPGIHHVSLVSS